MTTDGAPVTRVFLLSPAHLGGRRAKILLNPSAQFTLAQNVRQGIPTLGEVFSFLSGLYFRGKFAYAQTFARPPAGVSGVWVITSNRGLVDPATTVDQSYLLSLSTTPIDESEPGYRGPLTRSAKSLAAKMPANCEVVLLGSVATGKYADILLEIFGEQLFFPIDFVGRGDMSRGALMLRSAEALKELEYRVLKATARKGARAPRIDSMRSAQMRQGRG